MLIETKIGTYRWIDNWVKMPDFPKGNGNGRTHGVVVSKTGNILIFQQANPALLTFSTEGNLLSSWGNFPGAHGMTLVEENSVEFLWLTDEGTKQVVKTTLTGEVIQTLLQPDHPEYETKRYVPTWVAVSERRFGGDGGIWVADGYGAGLVHRFDANGKYLGTLDGMEGAGRFNCPHGVNFDPAKSEMIVADRGNKRLQIYKSDGTFLRSFGSDLLIHPDMCVPAGGLLFIPELNARLTILDENDQLIAILGKNDGVDKRAGWPDNREWLEEGKFNSPHSAAIDANGNIFVVEWIIGGRVIKLQKMTA